jgi:hypothetical protein
MSQKIAYHETLTVESHDILSPAVLAEWQAFVQMADHHHPHQDARFGDVVQAERSLVVYVTGRDRNGTLCAVGMFAIKPLPLLPGCGLYALCQDGPICDDANTLVRFLELAILLPVFAKVGRLRVAPCWIDSDAMALQSVLAANNWITEHSNGVWGSGWIDIRAPADEVLASLSKSARREIRRAERVGVSTRPLTHIDEAREFLRSLNGLRRSRGLKLISESGFDVAFRSFYRTGKEGVIIGAFHDNQFLAGLQIHRSNKLAHAMHFTVEPGRLHDLSNLRIAPLVWFQGMLWARAQGCTALDVEGWRAILPEADPHARIHKYKGEFAPRQVYRLAEHRKSVNLFIDTTADAGRYLNRNARSLLHRMMPG